MKQKFGIAFLVSLIVASGPIHAQAAPVLAVGEQQRLAVVDALVNEAVKSGNIPGAVVLIGHDGKVVYRKAFGSRSIEPSREAMTLDTIFDMASLTKCLSTATSVMQLIQEGKVRLNSPVSVYLPEFAQNGKESITVRELLTHYSGLRPDLDLKEPWTGKDTAYRMVMQERPTHAPGTRFEYSDINYITLGFLVEKVSGEPLNEYAAKHIYQPLGMKDTRYLPATDGLGRIAPTQYDENGKMLRGVVHDPTARRMGGVAGHAGLFSTADDLSIYAEEMLHGEKLLSRVAIDKMTTPQQPSNGASLRAIGWDIDSPFSSNRGDLLPIGSYGHTGFTGTSLWIDPVTDSYIVILTNAVHPNGHGSVVALRGRIATAVTAALQLKADEKEALRLSRITGYSESMMAARRFTVRNGDVKAGIDVLVTHGFSELHPDAAHPVRIGLVANQTSVDAQGHRTADLLAHQPGLQLGAIFSPEHGVDGVLDTTAIGNSTDIATGAPVYSVYGDGDAKRRPTNAQLAQVDAIVYDIQDIGVRFYTYESTMGYFLEAAAKAGKPIYILDRPNPIGGAMVQGPVADAGRESFVSYGRTPVRHGMTMGELAQLFNGERALGARLTVVRMEGWQRGDWYDSTGRMWINPSPNMRSQTEAELYPGVGLIEGTNISVGRGTDTPFEVIGAPWIDSLALARILNAREINGVRFIPVAFTPDSSNYAKQKCGGVRIVLTDRDALDAPELGIEIASAVEKLYPKEYKLSGIDFLTRNKATLDALMSGSDARIVADGWRDEIDKFTSSRAKYLLY